jgi:hypothetical protein
MYKDATYQSDGTDRYANRWTLPNLNPRRSPVCYLKLKMCCVEGASLDARECLWLRMNNVFSETVLVNERSGTTIVGGTLLGMLIFSDNTDHYNIIPESAPQIQISTNLSYIEFDLISPADGSIVYLDGGDASHTLNLILEIEYPEHNEVSNTMVGSYIPSEVGMPPFNRL